MINNQIYEYLATLRDLVNEYEEVIDLLKTMKNLIGKDEITLSNILKKVEKIKNKTVIFINTYKNTAFENIDQNTMKYIKTYSLYLQMVSIPYIIDLLTDTLMILKKSGNEYASKIINKTISEFKELKTNIKNINTQQS